MSSLLLASTQPALTLAVVSLAASNTVRMVGVGGMVRANLCYRVLCCSVAWLLLLCPLLCPWQADISASLPTKALLVVEECLTRAWWSAPETSSSESTPALI